MGKIRWTDESVTWLHKIHDFIAADKPQAAQKVVREIYRKVESLKEYPESGYRATDYPHHHIRILLYGHYRIVYLIKDNRDIDILGVFHGALDLKKYLEAE